jgi:hypothetical protein
MKTAFDPLAFVFVPFAPVDESPALVAFACVDSFDAHMLKLSRAISTDAHAAYIRQRSELINAALLRSTAEMCEAFAALRSTMPLGLN